MFQFLFLLLFIQKNHVLYNISRFSSGRVSLIIPGFSFIVVFYLNFLFPKSSGIDSYLYIKSPSVISAFILAFMRE